MSVDRPMKKYLISILITILALAAFCYIVPYHGTRLTEVYDIGRETEFSDFGTLPLETNVEVKQHFAANTYCLKGIHYILLGIDEETAGELEFCVETLAGKRLFSRSVSYQNIEPGQWENVELPTHLLQGQEYILKVVNTSEDVVPYILTGSNQTVSQVETKLIIDNQEQAQQLMLGFGFRSEYSRIGKILICLCVSLIWCYTIYALWIKKKSPVTVMQTGSVDNRKYYYDFLRVAAIWMVIYNHTVLNGFMLFTEEQGTVIFWIEQFFSIFIVIAVPLFWMMSGALLLPKEEDLKTLFQKRILRFFVVLIVFTLLQYGYRYYTGKLDLEVDGNYFQWVYQLCDGVPAYWYLYAYLGYLFMLPVLRKIVKGLKKVEFQYVFIVYTIFTGVLPLFEYFVLKEQYHLRSDFEIPVLASSCITFTLMGYYIEYVKKEEEFTLGKLALWILASVSCIALTAIATTYRCKVNDKWSEVFTQYFFKGLIIVPAYTVFYGVKLWAMKHEVLPKVKKIATVCGGATFGLMLIENIVREKMNFVFDLLTPHFGKFLGGMLWVTAIVVVGIVISAILKKLPIWKKLL